MCLLHADLIAGARAGGGGGAADRGATTCRARTRSRPSSASTSARSTTVVNAYLRPRVPRLPAAASPTLADDVLVMTSAGGLVPVGDGGRAAGGAAAVGTGGRRARPARRPRLADGFPDAVTFDMGGTSTDVCLVARRRARARRPARGGRVPGPPAVARRAHDRRRRRLDRPARPGRRAGRRAPRAPAPTRARPATAGAAPSPTVTDADLVAGRIPRRRRASPGSGGSTWTAAERGARRRRRDAPRACSTVVDAAMERARARGLGRARASTPAGSRWWPSAAPGRCTPARSPTRSGMPAVIVPARAGVLSAVGLLAAPAQHDLVRSWPTPGDHDGPRRRRDELAAEAAPSSPAADAGGERRRRGRPPRSTAGTRARATS